MRCPSTIYTWYPKKSPVSPFTSFTKLNLIAKEKVSFSLIDSRLPNGHFRHSSAPESCLQHSTYAFMLFISILTLTKQWRRREMEKNDERLSHFEKENWYLIPIIKINWHFPSPTRGSCVCTYNSCFSRFAFPLRQSRNSQSSVSISCSSKAALTDFSLFAAAASFSTPFQSRDLKFAVSQELNKFLINRRLS